MEGKFQIVCFPVDRFILEQRHVAFCVSFHGRSSALLCLASYFLVVFSQSVILHVGSSKIQGRLPFTSVTLCDERELITCTKIKPTFGVLAQWAIQENCTLVCVSACPYWPALSCSRQNQWVVPVCRVTRLLEGRTLGSWFSIE